MTTVKIKLDGNEIEVVAGLTKAGDLYERLELSPDGKWLYLDKDGDIDIPLLPDDFILIHGGEVIFEGDINQQIGENPHVRNRLHPTFNDKKLEKGCNRAKITGHELRKWDDKLPSSKLFVDLESQVDAFIQDDWTLVIQDSDCFFTIPADENDVIDLEKCARSGRRPPRGQDKYRIKIDGQKYDVGKQYMNGQEILALIGKTYAEWSLNWKFLGGRRKPVEANETVDFANPGIERFETIRMQAQQG